MILQSTKIMVFSHPQNLHVIVKNRTVKVMSRMI